MGMLSQGLLFSATLSCMVHPSPEGNVPSSTVPSSVAVIGAGISGLAAAHKLLELNPNREVWLIDAAPQPGGIVYTEAVSGFLVERSADSFITTVPWGIDLCRRIGLAQELLETDPANRRAFVVRKGKLHVVPDGFMLMAPRRIWPVMRSGLLSPLGKLRLLAEYLVPRRRSDDDESLAAFARRRLGREAFERLVQPLVSGIYTADAELLSVQAALPRFAQMEREHGSLIRAARQQKSQSEATEGETIEGESGARYSMFVAPREGLSQFTGALADRIANMQRAAGQGGLLLGTAVRSITPWPEGGWSVTFAPKDGQIDRPPLEVGAVIVATPAYQAARLLAEMDRPLAEALAGIPYAGASIVAVGYRRDQIAHPLDGFGLVVPAVEKRDILSVSFSSVKFAGRAPKQYVLMRVFLGGASRPDLVQADDDHLRRTAARELESLLGVTGTWTICRIFRWPGAMPQYHVGHKLRVATIEELAARRPGLALAGNAYHGVGIPDCIHSGEQAAERV